MIQLSTVSFFSSPKIVVIVNVVVVVFISIRETEKKWTIEKGLVVFELWANHTFHSMVNGIFFLSKNVLSCSSHSSSSAEHSTVEWRERIDSKKMCVRVMWLREPIPVNSIWWPALIFTAAVASVFRFICYFFSLLLFSLFFLLISRLLCSKSLNGIAKNSHVCSRVSIWTERTFCFGIFLML